jgi:hypothetical protein
MRSWVGNAFLGGGAVVAVGGLALATFGMPAHIPALLVTIAVVKVTFGGAVGLLATGAWLRRRALRARAAAERALNAPPGDGHDALPPPSSRP